MSTGPTLIYDKSTIQSLTEKEAFWLSMYFRPTLTVPLFFEILGNLKKPARTVAELPTV